MVITAHWGTHIKFLQAVFKVSEMVDDVDIFNNEVIRVAVQSAWEQYGFRYHCLLTLIYMGLLASLSYSNYVFHLQDNHPALYIAVVLTCVFFALEIKECWRDWSDYFLDYKNIPNYFQLAGYILTLVGCGIRFQENFDTYDARIILSIATIILWVNFLSFLRPFTFTGPLIRMISYVILKLLPFFLCY
jgi:hypothetical protein